MQNTSGQAMLPQKHRSYYASSRIKFGLGSLLDESEGQLCFPVSAVVSCSWEGHLDDLASLYAGSGVHINREHQTSRTPPAMRKKKHGTISGY